MILYGRKPSFWFCLFGLSAGHTHGEVSADMGRSTCSSSWSFMKLEEANVNKDVQ